MKFNPTHTLITLEHLVNRPSPSGDTRAIIHYLKDRFTASGIEFTTTQKGAILVTLKGHDDSKARLLTAHVDTLGAMVKEIKADGRLKLSKLGGFNWNSVEGEYCIIHRHNQLPVRGTILMHQASVHVYKESGELPRNDENIEVRIDAITRSKEETEALGISVGDYVSFDPCFETLDNGFVKSRHLDDKAAVALLIELAEQIASNAITLPYTTYLYISNNEEVGFGGNSAIPANVTEYVAVDMGAIGDGQNSDEFSVSICAKDSSGPYHHGLTSQMRALCSEFKIPHKVDIYPYYGSDASVAIRAGYDLKHALIGPGIDASHSMERTHIDSLHATFNLLVRYVESEMIGE